MGNSTISKLDRTNQDPPADEPEVQDKTFKRPALVRMQSGKMEEYECTICLSKEKKGIACLNDHFICKDCFSPYVHSICEERFKLVENGGKMKCPVPNCNSESWSSHEVLQVAHPGVVEQYIDILVSCLGSKDISKDKEGDSAHADSKTEKDRTLEIQQANARAIANALTLLCPNPNCNVALDPNPDGCCAMKCPFCGAYFCWLCFRLQANNSACHSHVCKCDENPDKILFAQKKTIDAAQKRRRIEAIRRVLQQSASVQEKEEAAAAENIAKLNTVTAAKTAGGGSVNKSSLKAPEKHLFSWLFTAPAPDESSLPTWKRQRFQAVVQMCIPILKGADISPIEIFASSVTGPPALPNELPVRLPVPPVQPNPRLPVPPLQPNPRLPVPPVQPNPQVGHPGREGGGGREQFVWTTKRNCKLVAATLIFSLFNIYSGLFLVYNLWLAAGYSMHSFSIVNATFVAFGPVLHIVLADDNQQGLINQMNLQNSLTLWATIMSTAGLFANYEMLKSVGFGMTFSLWISAVFLTSLEVILEPTAQNDTTVALLRRLGSEVQRYSHHEEVDQWILCSNYLGWFSLPLHLQGFTLLIVVIVAGLRFISPLRWHLWVILQRVFTSIMMLLGALVSIMMMLLGVLVLAFLWFIGSRK